MRFLGLFALWATLTFVPCYAVSHGYQQAIAGAAGRLAAPRNSEIEWEDIEIFYPFDLGVFVALCLASGWTPWRARFSALGLGLALLILIELVSLVLAIRILLGAMAPGASEATGEEALRLATGIIRVIGLIAAATVWFALLGRQRLSLAARAWLGP